MLLLPHHLHHTLILTQILVALEKEGMLGAIGAGDRQLSWALLRGNHCHCACERADACNGLARLIGARHGELEISRLQELRAHVLKLEDGELRDLLRDPSEDIVINVPCGM